MTKLIFEKSMEGITGVSLSEDNSSAENSGINPKFLRKEKPVLPEVSELEAMRHFKELSDKNFCVESGFYPLGSCTMKYNPKVNEYIASLEGFTQLHPHQDDEDVQGALELMYKLQEALKEITGMSAITLQGSAGAHGELCGMMIVKHFFKVNNEPRRKKVIIPDSAHGTNPASAGMCGFEILKVNSNEKGQVDISHLKELFEQYKDEIAAIMMTNPNTLGIFEEKVQEISEIAHQNGSLLYYDGANLNAVMGITNPKIMGFDIVHLNLHKTFSTPHGGGGPGAGPVGVVEKLKEYLPVPVVDYDGTKYFRKYNLKNTIGKIKEFQGNFGVLVKAYCYILMKGKNLKNVSQDAVLNANYLKEKLKPYFDLPYDCTCMHEFVLSGSRQKENGVHTLEIAKRLMDYKVHPPTVYFPLIVPEAIMIEPTESENKQRLDDFVEAMIKIANEAESTPQKVLDAPHCAPVKRVDETNAARHLDLRYKPEK